MTKSMKLMSMLLAIALAVAILPAAAFAVSEEVSVCNEYDMILQARAEATGNPNFVSEEAAGNEYENAEELYLKRASMSETELQGLGYTAEQIKVLKEYDGGPLEENPQLRAVSATLTASLGRYNITTNSVKLAYQWSWSGCPIITNMDIIGFSWAAINPQNQPISLAFAPNDGDMQITYQYVAGTTTTTESVAMTIGTGTGATAYNSAQGRFALAKFNTSGGIRGYAKSGSAVVTLRLPNASANNLYEVNVAAKYGHSTIALSPSITISGAGSILDILSMFSFSPSASVETLGAYSYRFGVNGSVIKVYP